MKTSVYDLLTDMVSITTTVLIKGRNGQTICTHSAPHLVKEDVPESLWKVQVQTIAVTNSNPGVLTIFVDR